MSRNFETCYVSTGCNKSPNVADWGRNNLICYGACNSVVVYDPQVETGRGKITHTLHSHKEKVNCTRWIKTFTELPENEIISASADGTAIIWSWSNENQTWLPDSTLTGHNNIINVADGLFKLKPGEKYVKGETDLTAVTASIDSSVKIWTRKSGKKIECVDTIDWGSGFCLDVRLAPLANTELALLACAADDNKVHLFVETQLSEIDESVPDHRFKKVHVLIGHEDWVRSLDFMLDVNNDLYLATASQDTYIRIHKIHRKSSQSPILKRKKVSEMDLKENLEAEEKIFTVAIDHADCHFAVNLETVLAGHEGWVYGVSWHPPDYSTENLEISGRRQQRIKLLSTSLDKTMIIWSPDESGAWIEEARLGEVGGNSLGFYGGKFGCNGLGIMGHGYQGSFHIWKKNEGGKGWEPCVVVGGHIGEVMDLAWGLDGNYVLSVGADQTTRLHAPWVRSEDNEVTWHEIARPQIHGYDMSCIAVLGKYKYASGAEEKVIRAFLAPNNFVENFKRITGIGPDKDDKTEDLPQGATVPALGLTNKPVFEQMKKEGYIVDDDYPDLYFSPIHLTKPPTEENLMQNTLWPEAQKLYGHGYEIFSLAARSDGVVLASSCKATSAEHASIILWNVKTWLQIQKLTSHQLTVSQLSFSPNGKYLLSVSRDRRWTLFGVKDDGKSYEILFTTDNKTGFHTRIIWCCAWTFDSTTFATGSRDGKIGIWGDITTAEGKTDVKLLTSLELPKESITALAFSPVLIKNFHLLAIGLESGVINLYKYCNSEMENLWVVFQGDLGHHLTVKRLSFRPKLGKAGVDGDENVIQLASCGSDHFLKIYNIFLNLL